MSQDVLINCIHIFNNSDILVLAFKVLKFRLLFVFIIIKYVTHNFSKIAKLFLPYRFPSFVNGPTQNKDFWAIP